MRIAILGAGGHGRVVQDLLKATGKFEIAGFFDHKFFQHEQIILPIIGSEADLIYHWRKLRIEQAVVAIGNNQIRKNFFEQLIKVGLEMPVLIHPSATVSPEARIGPGTVICGHSFIGPGAVIGANCIVNTAANIDHDCLLADHIHICPGVNLAGGIKIGSCSLIGTGANIIPKIRIGEQAIVGAGSTVISDVFTGITVAGVPAHKITGRDRKSK